MSNPKLIDPDSFRVDGLHWAPKRLVVHRAYDETDPRLKEDVHGDSLAWYNARRSDVVLALHRIDPENKMRHDKLEKVATGLFRHEVAHAAYSGWMEYLPKNLAPEIINTLNLFEEARVEYRAINAQLDNRPFFRSALRHGLGRHDSAMNTGDIAMAWGLMAGRRLARTIYEDEFEGIDIAARNAIGDETIEILWDILAEAVAMGTQSDRGRKAIIRLAKEWNDLAGIPSSPMKSDIKESKAGSEGKPSKEKGEGKGGGKSEEEGDGEGEGDGDAEGSGSGGQSATGTDRMDGSGSGKPIPESEKGEDAQGEHSGDFEDTGHFDESQEQASTEGNDGDHHGFGEGGARGIPAEKREEFEREIEEALKTVTARFDDDRVELANPMRTAAKVFGNPPKYDGDGYSSWTEREPTREVRLAATSLARQLEQVNTPTIIKMRTNMALPPGRLRNREAVRGSAERSMGMMSTAKPWKGQKRSHTQAPPTVIGIMTDVSGSMAWAEQTVGELAYIFAHAGNMVGARTAAVVFGNETEMSVAPGEVPTKVRIHAADGGSESCDTAYAALDGVLHFTDGPPGNKILVVYSDAHFVSAPDAAAHPHWVKKFLDAGVTMIWVNRAQPHKRNVSDPRIQVVTAGSDAQGMVTHVMAAIRKGVEVNAQR